VFSSEKNNNSEMWSKQNGRALYAAREEKSCLIGIIMRVILERGGKIPTKGFGARGRVA